MKIFFSPSLKWHRIYAFSLRHIYPLRRDFDLLSDMLYWPIIDVLLWGVTSKWMSEGSSNSSVVASILIGLILWNVIWRSQSDISRNLMDEIWNNNLVNLFSTPLSLGEWIIGVVTLSIAKMFFTVTLITVVILMLYSVNVFILGWWIIPFFLCAMMTGWWVGFISAGVVLRWGPKVQTVIWTLPGILLPLSVVYFPLAMLPTFLKPVAYLLPTTYIFESMRSLLNTGVVSGTDILLSFCINFIYLFFTIKWFVSSFKKSLEFGLGRFN